MPSPVPFDLPMVLIKPPEACSTAEVYKVIYRASNFDPKYFLNRSIWVYAVSHSTNLAQRGTS